MAEGDVGAVAPVETPVAAPQATPALDPTAGQVEENQQEADPPEKMLPQSEVNKLIAKEKAKEARRTERAIRAEVERDLLRQQLDARDRPQAQPQPQQAGAPQYKDFEGRPYHEFVAAHARWEAKQEFEAQFQGIQKEREQREAATRHETAKQKLFAGAAEFPDFEDVVGSPDVLISPVMAQAITESDIPAKLAYYLGQNLKESERIFNLPATQQVRELAKIESKLTAPPKPTSTPPPIVPNKPNASVEKRLEDADVDEFFTIRKRQLAAKKGR